MWHTNILYHCNYSMKVELVKWCCQSSNVFQRMSECIRLRTTITIEADWKPYYLSQKLQLLWMFSFKFLKDKLSSANKLCGTGNPINVYG